MFFTVGTISHGNSLPGDVVESPAGGLQDVTGQGAG